MKEVFIIKAAIVKNKGILPVIEEIEVPVQSTEDELILTVKASALTMVGKSSSLGSHYSSHDAFPKVAGIEGVGEDISGNRFYFIGSQNPYGALAEQTLVNKKRTVKIPEKLDTITAAAIANPGMSSYAALVYRAKITSNDVVLINGATGTAGILAVKMAYALGAKKVIAIGRNKDALERSGADEYLSSSDYDNNEQTQYLVDLGKIIADVTIVLDYLWGNTAQLIMQAIYQFSNHQSEIRYIQIGTLVSPEINVPGALLRSTKLTLMGSGLGSVGSKELLSSAERVFELAVINHWHVPNITFKLEDIKKAWKAPSHPRPVIII
ncbi:zinc-binding alcohol dehydrogenase family protein [Lactobacillus sp. UCMA15818]|uniref:quinone oxidoreductase family protein n=1 Tax=Lactobacillus sp. UCMA15818 TaxID=2583394 RepID=UPI0025B23A25|nr:zinc-binding alcohol dehydrogenase family protein [Lactobacillus sp. UCMA15818]MDN2452223.1 zinc-binding alcohol dehydrogenase family protein [Lactobacillus sp. UCMA15818]